MACDGFSLRSQRGGLSGHSSTKGQGSTADTHLLSVLEAGSRRLRGQQAWFLLGPPPLLRDGSLLVSSRGLSLYLCSNVLFLKGHQSDWIRVLPNDLLLT